VHPDHPGRGVFADRPDAAFLRRLGQTLFPESQKEA
jgi:hypothetical protein